MSSIWNIIFYQPIYNGLIFTVSNITFGDVGFAVIFITVLVKLIISPLTERSIKSQVLMKKMEPELKLIKKEFPNKEEQSRKTFELYKKYGTNPFSGCLVVLIQLPVILALYWVFRKGVSIDPSLIYHFINIPVNIHTKFLGLIEMESTRSIVLALFAGLSQFAQGYLASPIKPKVEVVKEMPKEAPTFQDQLSDSMQMNIRYVLPVFIAFIAYQLSAAVALYWIVSNIFTIVQEWYIRKQLEKKTI